MLVFAGRRPGRAAAVRTSWTFAPQVRLSMTMLLPSIVREVRGSPGVVVRMTPAPTPIASRARERVTEPTRARLVRAGADHPAPGSVRDRLRPVVTAGRRAGARSASPAGVDVVTPAGVRVIASTSAARRRFERGTAVPLASPALALAGGASILHRVRDERRRVEQRTAQPTTTRARAAQPTVLAPTPALAAPMTFNAGWTEPARDVPSVPAPIDIPRLTDHVVRAINERIVAQHERMGRAF
jgi:hypothetical protein